MWVAFLFDVLVKFKSAHYCRFLVACGKWNGVAVEVIENEVLGTLRYHIDPKLTAFHEWKGDWSNVHSSSDVTDELSEIG